MDPRPGSITSPVAPNEMEGRITAFDWSDSPLGPQQAWPQHLKIAVRLVLDSRYPMFIWWGDHKINLYNDAYRPVLGRRHPWALGRPAREVWSEIWSAVGPQADIVFQQAQATWNDRATLLLARNGYLEETFFTFSYSPILSDNDRVDGLFCACSEETERVISERRLAFLRQLAVETADAKTAQDACSGAAAVLDACPRDVPFALLYLADSAGDLHLATSAGIERSPPLAPPRISRGESVTWFSDSLAQRTAQTLRNLAPHRLPGRPWPEPAPAARCIPLHTGGPAAAGFLILGTSPLRPLDSDYEGFLDLVGASIASAIANARAFEEERLRAEALADLDRAKTAFFSNVSHEFRTPLTLMLGPLRDLKESLVAPENAPHDSLRQLDLIERNGLRLLKLVNTLLNYSRIESGRLQARFESLDLAAFTSALAGLFRSAIEKAELRLIVDCPPLPRPVTLDRDLWENVVFNLLSNALKFTFHGEIEVALRPGPSDSEVELRIRDTGVGIPAAQLPKIFERFHRVPDVHGRTHEGSGIGLAFVQEIVRLHHGTISVDSSEGRGTTFTVRLPFDQPAFSGPLTPRDSAIGASFYLQETEFWLTPPPSVPVASESAPVGESDAPSPSLDEDLVSRPSILLADDNPDMLAYVASLLEAEGYQVTAVRDGLAALEAARQHPPDLILTDVMMPHLDGIALLNALRADPHLQTVPVLLLTARAGDEARLHGIQSAPDDYITKPFTGRELVARISAALRLTALRRDAHDRFRHFADASPAILWVTEADGTCSFLSRSWSEFTGQSSVDGLGFGWLDAVHPEDRPTARAQFFQANAERAPLHLEHRLLRADGSIAWVLDVGRPRFDRHGAFLGYAGFVLDISDRKRAEIELHRLSAILQAVFDTSSDAVFVKDCEGRLVMANPATCDFIGKPWSELQGKSDHEWHDIPAEADQIRALDLAILRSGVPQIREEKLTRNGRTRYLLSAKNLWSNERGEPLGIIGISRDITQRRHAEAQLRESEARFRNLADQAPVFVWMTDPTASVTYANRTLLDYLDLPASGSLAGSGWHDSVHPDDLPAVRATYASALESQQPYELEVRLRHGPSRVFRWFLVKGVPRLVSGVCEGFIGVGIDIHDRREAQLALLRRNQRLAILSDGLAGLLSSSDPDEHVRRLYDQVAEHLELDLYCYYKRTTAGDSLELQSCSGLPVEVAQSLRRIIFGQGISGTVAQSGQPIETSQLDGTFEGSAFAGLNIRCYVCYPLLSGEHLLGTLAFGSSSRQAYSPDELDFLTVLCRSVAVALDRSRVDAALQESERRYRSLAEAMPQLAWTSDPDGRCDYLSSQWVRYTGFPMEDQLGYKWLDLVHPDDRDRTIAAWHAAVDGRSEYDLEFRIRNADGHYGWFKTRARPVHDADGRVVKWFGTCTDISEIVEARETLATSRIELERLVHERTAKLQETIGELETFSYSISHDMRAPLRAMQSFARFLEEECGDRVGPEGGVYIQRIISASHRMDRLIQDVLTYSRVARAEFVRESVPLEPLLRGLIESYPDLQPPRADVCIVSPIPHVLGNEAGLTQCFSNLLGNAVKFVPPGRHPEVRVWAERDNGRIAISVRDNGIGIDPMIQRKIFDMFYRLDSGYEGTGIGLAVVRKAVSKMGGAISVDSAPDHGSTFRVLLDAAA